VFVESIATAGEYDATMNWREHIDRNPEVIGGKPKIKGTRIGVEHILERLGDGWTVEQLIESYPRITAEQIHACQAYAAEIVATDEVVDIPQTAA
jgi:uncharacterized protein (DUF433 family)